ncbi:MAG: hypothetical protein JSV89_22025 [Spirochaetaceae bacterium]|nr:MAG: hypothetical protein JSV89_22025 [Spirochaetaceae bacterium]
MQTAAGLSTTRGIEGDLRIGKEERQILRDLALQVAELAARPTEAEKAALWTRHNDLQETRPLVFCDPENGWNEIIPQEQILCRKPLFRVWEMTLRKEIFWGREMGDDRVIQPYFNVPYNYSDSSWGLEEIKIGGGEGGSYVWEAPIRDYERDFQRLQQPRIEVDYRTTRRIVELAQDVFADILNVRLRGVWWWTLGMTWDFIRLRGLNNLMLDMYDHPQWIHRTMAFLRDGTLKKLDFLEEHGLLALNTAGSYVGSGGFGWTTQLPQSDFDPKRVRTIDMWGFAESQETVGVSPQMFAEFIFPYQLPILERFGLNCYGCCEPLDSRWQIIRRIPRLRRVSVSPWSDPEAMADLLNGDYILSLKPSPSPLAEPVLDEELVRSTLRKNLKATLASRVELIMKDNHTLGGSPANAVHWCRIAREEIDRL